MVINAIERDTELAGVSLDAAEPTASVGENGDHRQVERLA
jgi:hypothetical protein